MRAYYTRLSPVIDKSHNNALLTIGTIMIMLPPGIAFFDMYEFQVYHNVFALSFFVLAFVYMYWITGEFN